MSRKDMSRKDFDLNLLSVLDALIAERHVTRASRRLSRSQPAISNSLHRLRDLLRDELLVRGPDGMNLTPRAEAIRGPLREIMTLIDEKIIEETTFDPSLATGVYRLSMPDRLALAVIPALTARLTKMAPAMDLHLMTADRRQALHLLEDDRADVALGWFDEKPRNINSEFLGDEELYCVFRKGHPVTRSKASLKSILSFPHLIVSATGGRSAIFDDLLARYNLKRRAHVSVSNYTAVPHLLKHSDMIAVLTKLASDVLERSYGLSKQSVPFEFSKIATNMIWHSRNERDGKQAWLRKQIKEVYGSL
jgi:LysR family transcriptional regulator, mexEF-oprN operon transcriptional activator